LIAPYLDPQRHVCLEGRPMLCIRRREFITLFGGAAATWPMEALAQQGRRIGVLMARAESDPPQQAYLQAFRIRIQELGWTDGDNVRIDYRWTAGVLERFRTAAKELVALRPDVILADATPSVVALRGETQTVPIVFVNVNDPIGSGFVASLARPGGTITGFTNFEFSLGGKWLSLLKEIAPNLKRVALLYNPMTAPYFRLYLRAIETAAPLQGVEPVPTPVEEPAAIDRAVRAFAREPNGGLLILPDSFLFTHRDRVIALAAQHSLPVIGGDRFYARSGGLIAYGTDVAADYRGAASYVDRILRGAKPSDLPVQAPTAFQLHINLKTARALGLKVPATLLAIADEVIE
jgi:putative ABC transport system substrate-binding protein